MPQASEELRAQWPGSYEEAINFLVDRGYSLRHDWSWRLPSPSHTIGERESSAIRYLIDEWDFDGVVSDKIYAIRAEMRRQQHRWWREWYIMTEGAPRQCPNS